MDTRTGHQQMHIQPKNACGQEAIDSAAHPCMDYRWRLLRELRGQPANQDTSVHGQHIRANKEGSQTGRTDTTGLDSLNWSKFQCTLWGGLMIKGRDTCSFRAGGGWFLWAGRAERRASSTGWRAGWVSGEEGSHGTPSGSCGASPWPTLSSGWSPPWWRRPLEGTGS